MSLTSTSTLTQPLVSACALAKSSLPASSRAALGLLAAVCVAALAGCASRGGDASASAQPSEAAPPTRVEPTPTPEPATAPPPAAQGPEVVAQVVAQESIEQVEQRIAPRAAPSTPPVAVDAIAFPPMIVQEPAMAIVNRALARMKDLRSLECVTLTEQVGVPEEMRLSGLGLKRRVQLRFVHTDAISMPIFRITHIDQGPEGEVEGAVAVFDGKRAILIDHNSKAYFDPAGDWLKVVGPHLPAIPRWYFVERAAAARQPEEIEAAKMLLPDIVGARILRVEELDGQTCDVVEVFKVQSIVDEPDEAPEVVDELRYTETIHYARSDGMPRRVVLRMLSGPAGTITPGETTTMHYWGVVMNPDFAPSVFRAEPPAGYTAVDGS